MIANVKNDGMMMSKIKMFRISDELSSLPTCKLS